MESILKYLTSLADFQFNKFLGTHVAAANYKIPFRTENKQITKLQEYTFQDNESIWNEIIHNRIRRTDLTIKLNGFSLFEWLPRSPGLFHTPRAEMARDFAINNIVVLDNEDVVYDPYGKISMLEGGVGAIRLKPITMENESYYLMTASSSSVCHEGFPLAVPESYRNEVIDEINGYSEKNFEITGKLIFVPDFLSELYADYRNIPQLFLKVESIDYSNRSKDFSKASVTRTIDYGIGNLDNYKVPIKDPNALWVSVAVSFLSKFEGYKKTYATYVSFDPREDGAAEKAIKWLEDIYVVGKYKGLIVTDFDQQQKRFENAPFSLKKVMNLSLEQKEIKSIAKNSHINTQDFIGHQNQVLYYLELHGDNHGGIQLGGEGNSQSINIQDVENTKIDKSDIK